MGRTRGFAGIAGLFAALTAFALMPVAQAAAADEIDWGFRHQFRSYAYAFGTSSPITVSSGASCTGAPPPKGGCPPQPNVTSGVLGWTAAATSGSVLSGGSGSVTGDGSVLFNVDQHFFTMLVEDPLFTISGSNVVANARIKVDSSSPMAPSSDARVDVGSFTLTGPPVVTPSSVTFQTGAGSSSQEFSDSTGGLLAPGSELDPVKITLPVAAPATGTPIGSANVTLKADPAKPSKRQLKLSAKDSGVVLGDYDPTADGASLQVVSSIFDDSYALPASNWKKTTVKKTGAVKQYKYTDSKNLLGPVKSATLKNGQLTINAAGAGLGHSLASQPANLRIAFGSGDNGVCAGATGKVKFKAPKSLTATKNPAPADCPAL